MRFRTVLWGCSAKAGGYCMSQTGLGWGWLPRGRTSPVVAPSVGCGAAFASFAYYGDPFQPRVCFLLPGKKSSSVNRFFSLGPPLRSTLTTHLSPLASDAHILSLRQKTSSKHSTSREIYLVSSPSFQLPQGNHFSFQDRDLFQA